jgi:apolipoprotein N-acyltransferase
LNQYLIAERVSSNKGTPLYFVCITAILNMISMTFFDFHFLAWVGSIFLLYYFISNEITGKKAFKAFFLYGVIFNFSFLHWLFNLHPLTWMGYTITESFILTFLAWFFLSLFESLFYAILGYIAFHFKPVSHYIKGFLAVLVILLVEWIRSLGDLGFPWARLAISQYEIPLFIQTSSLFGILFVSFIILIINLLLALSLYSFLNDRSKKSVIFAAFSLGIFFSNIVFGYFEINQVLNTIDEINITIIQGNVSVSDKWVNKEGETVKEKHFRLTRDAASKYQDTDFMFWAESAVPTNLTENPDLVDEISELSQQIGIPLIIGAILYDDNGGLRNSIVYIDSTGIKYSYYKRHPVPVGEFIPFKDFVFKIFPRAKDSKIASEGLVAGDTPRLIPIDDNSLGALVCYDSIFPYPSRDAVKNGANILFIASNDSWYKKSNALKQHNAQAVFRAVENRKYVIRAANTGISSVIDPKGRITSMTKTNVEAVLNDEAMLNDIKSFYSVVGDIFIYFIIGIYIILLIYTSLSKKHQKNTLRM